MTRDLLATAAVSHAGGTSMSVPKEVSNALGEPDEVAFFINRDTGVIEVVQKSEVSMR